MDHPTNKIILYKSISLSYMIHNTTYKYYLIFLTINVEE